jgi:tetratricopeptide (TPR) repeat protein
MPTLNEEHAMKRDLSLRVAALLASAAMTISTIAVAESVATLDARDRAPALALVVFQDMPGGAEILRGSYQKGLDEATSALAKHPSRNKLVLKTNVCAARVKLGQFEDANESCETALANRPPVSGALTAQQFRAVAHVNHGVVHFMQGDQEFAMQEFSRAKAMYPRLRVAASNLELTEQSLREPRIEVGETL